MLGDMLNMPVPIAPSACAWPHIMCMSSHATLLYSHWDAVQIFIKHCGEYQFRGVSEQQSVFQISRGPLEGRMFPSVPANPKKAAIVGPARGLQAVVILSDALDQRAT